MEKRFLESQRVAVMGITGNIFLAVVKIAVGVIFKSQSLIADGANSIGDIINSVITFLGNKVASLPRDEEHQYGHGKAEAVATQVIGIIMCFIAIEVFRSSLEILLSGATGMSFSWSMIAISIVVIIAKIFMFIYANRIGKRYSNPLVLANAADHRTDVFVTSGTIIGIVFTMFGIWWMDSLVGMIIALWILVQGFGISKSAIKILMDSSIDTKILDSLRNTIACVEGVREVQRVTTHSMGIGYSVEVRIGLDCLLTIAEGHKIASEVKKMLLESAEIGDVIVHINPVPQRSCDYNCLKTDYGPNWNKNNQNIEL